MKTLLCTLTLIAGCYQTCVVAETLQTKPVAIDKLMQPLEKSFGGKIGVYAVNTGNHQVIQYRASERFPFQSTFKALAISALLKQSESHPDLLQQKITYTKSDLVFWSPITEKYSAEGMTLSALAAAAMTVSDNTATNLIVKKLGGPNAVATFARSIGDTAFRLDGWEPNLNSNPHDHRDTSTPEAMANSLQKCALGSTLTIAKRAQLVQWMKDNTTGAKRIRAGVPNGWIVADKTGSGNEYGISNDIALLYPPQHAPIVLAIYSVGDNKNSKASDAVLAATTRIIVAAMQ